MSRSHQFTISVSQKHNSTTGRSSAVPESNEFLDGKSTGLNPLIIFLIGIAYAVFLLYTLRCCCYRFRTRFITRNDNDNNQTGNGNNVEEVSVRTEKLPSFFKVVVLPNQDLCYGMANKTDDSNTASYAEQEDLSGLFFQPNKYNQSFYNGKEPEEDAQNQRIHIFRTASINLDSDTESIDLQNESDDNVDDCRELKQEDIEASVVQQVPGIVVAKVVAEDLKNAEIIGESFQQDSEREFYDCNEIYIAPV